MGVKLAAASGGSIELVPTNTASAFTVTVPASTTTMVGTDATQTLTNKTLTTPNIDSAQVATVSGTAPLYMCRAWVNFNSTGTVSIYGSGNCSSITDNGAGLFTFNFATAMPDVNYCVTTGATQSSSNNNGGVMNVFLSATTTYSAPLVGSFRLLTYHAANSALGDSTYNCLAVFR